MKFGIKKNDLVLEIGSGHNPYPRSDILCDRFLFNNKERSEYALRYDRPLVIANAEKLPFKNKSFDFVICRQVIEHSKSPIQFIKEMQRVGKRGVIICPRAVREKIFGWRDHHWWITRESGRLIFRHKKNKKENDFFHHLYQGKAFFRRYCLKHDGFLNIYFYWNKEIPIKVLNITGKDFLRKVKLEAEGFLSGKKSNLLLDFCFSVRELYLRLVNKLKKELSILKWKIRQNFNKKINLESLKELIICPECKNKIEILANSARCRKCNIDYPIKNNIPILLSKEEREKGF